MNPHCLALSIVAGSLANYFMGKRTAEMKPADILRQLKLMIHNQNIIDARTLRFFFHYLLA
jgi:hypothetical protein